MQLPDFVSPEFTDLVQSLKSGMCLFVGAGVSKLAEYKLWDELAKEMIKHFWQNRSSNEKLQKMDLSIRLLLENHASGNIIHVMDYLNWLDSDFFVKIIKKIFDETQEKIAIYEKFRQLMQLPNFIVQTNIDMGLQNHLSIQDSDIAINPTFSNAPKRINYIHGRIDNEKTWIFTRQQYNANYLNEKSAVMEFLTNIFMQYSVLFIGYSLRDFEVLQAIAKARLQESKMKFFLLESSYRDKHTLFQVNKSIYSLNYGIEIIPYEIEEKGYELLLEVLDAINLHIQPANTFVPSGQSLDSVNE